MSNPTWIVTVTAGPDAGRAVGVTAPDAGENGGAIIPQ